jgi:uncharacterized hydrophobic protein (TIGR00271 family)
MAKVGKKDFQIVLLVNHFRDGLAANLGIAQARKEEIYLDLLHSVTLKDISYWLEVILAAGIATLGLVLNSVAVIIGAMLISPLMGTILAGGLAFAAGDVILGLRTAIKLTLSCALAIIFAFILVGILPFKELTPEIISRTRPNTLDLVIALFSGALGSIATCKQPKGVVTSIPGVAIAVALMPPLCVVGYGIGIAASLSSSEGLQIARGGGLLFLTNLTAIVLMAMTVFLLLHIDTQPVRSLVRDWHKQEPESYWIELIIEKSPIPNRLKAIGSLPSRFVLILFPILILLFPLSQSLTQLRQEIIQKQQNNQIIKIGTELWREKFASLTNGQLRSEIGKVLVQEKDGKLVIQMRVFSSKLYEAEEKKEFERLLADRLNRTIDSVVLELLEIPTASNEIIARLVTENQANTQPKEIESFSITETQNTFLQTALDVLQSLKLPSSAQLVEYKLTTSVLEALGLEMIYLSDRDISPDAKDLLIEEIKNRLNFSRAKVRFKRISISQGSLTLNANNLEFRPTDTKLLDRMGQILQEQPNLQLEMNTNSKIRENIQKYLASKWQISPNRIVLSENRATSKGVVELKFNLIPNPFNENLL